jgi:hypothetical protein
VVARASGLTEAGLVWTCGHARVVAVENTRPVARSASWLARDPIRLIGVPAPASPSTSRPSPLAPRDADVRRLCHLPCLLFHKLNHRFASEGHVKCFGGLRTLLGGVLCLARI